MKKYIVTGGNDRSMELCFSGNEDSFLQSWIVTGDWSSEFWKVVWRQPPLAERVLLSWSALIQIREFITSIREVPADLSFGVFWDAYCYKVGDKSKAEKLWKVLTDADKIAVLAAIPRYLRFLSVRESLPQAHATTFLNQRRWENDFTVKK